MAIETRGAGRRLHQLIGDRKLLSWAFYDWANSAYATVVIAGFFPIFFRDYWSAGQESTAVTLHLGLANSSASVLLVVLAPLLGSIADAGSLKKRLLLSFAGLGIVTTGGLFLVSQGDWVLAWILFVLGTLGFMGANIFYDSLLVAVSSENDYDLASGLGFALGYLGGGLLFAFCVLLTFQPQLIGLDSAAEAVRLSFLLTASWWAVFTVPILLFVSEPKSQRTLPKAGAVRAGMQQFIGTFHEVRRLRVVVLFLLAYWLYIDGVDTIIRMAVDYGRALGFGAQSLVAALLITQFVGFPAAIAFGRLGQRIGPKRGIYVAIGVYMAVTVWGSQMSEIWEFYAIAVAIGLVQGGVQALSRSMYARLIPRDRAGEFFGFYNMLGKFAAILGPVMVGLVGELTGNPRFGILSLLVFFVLGAAILYLVDEGEGRRAAAALEGESAGD